MIWRTTLTHAIEGSIIISEPEGLSSSIIGLTRHPDFHSLVKEFKTSFKAYGTNGTYDGKREWVKNVESLHGCDSVIDILIEYAPDDYVFEVVFQGEVGIQTIIEALDFDHALEFTPVQLGFWRKAISRYDVPVDIQSAITIDGESASVVTPENLLLPSQTITKTSSWKNDTASESDSYNLPGVDSQLDYSGIEDIFILFSNATFQNEIKEISDSFDIPLGLQTDVINVAEILITKDESGNATLNYNANFRIEIDGSIYILSAEDDFDRVSGIDVTASIFFQKNADAPILIGSSAIGGPGVLPPSSLSFPSRDFTNNYNFSFSGSQPIVLAVSDSIKIYCKLEILFTVDTSHEDNNIYWGPRQVTIKDFINDTSIVLSSIFRNTNAPSFLIHDVIASVIQRTTGLNSFYSELLGSPDTQSRVYAQPGCYSNNVALKGLHLRGYLLADKKFSISMKEIWDGLNPLMNLSLGYETIAGENVIRLEKKEHCYDSSSMSVLLSGVQKIRRSYSDEYFNSVETGYNKGKIEDISGIDDPQKQTRASIFKNIGRKLQIISTWITQGLTIETARRTTIVKSADYKYDNDTFMIEVTKTGSDYTPRLDEDYDSVTNLLNEATRYNKRWVPSRMFLRWSKYIFNGIQDYIGTVYRFVSGDGNYTMTSERKPDSCPDNYGGNSLAENADIVVTNEHLYIPQEFEIEHYLTFAEFKTIDENRNLAIGVSQSATGHAAFFIKDLQFEILSGQIKMKGFFKDKFNIEHIPPTNFIVQGGKIFDATFDFSWE